MCGDGIVKVQVLRQNSVLQRQHDLDQTGDPRCRFEVPDVGLHRSDQQRPVRVTAGAVGGRGGLDLDRVTQRGARAVRLKVINLAADETGAGQRRRDEPLLCTPIGHRQTTGRAVLIDRAAPDDRTNRVAVALGIAEPLEHQNAASFAARIAVRGGVEGLASAVGGQAFWRARWRSWMPGSPKRSPHRPAPCRSHRSAMPGKPDARPPATRCTRYPPPSPALQIRARTPPGPR